MADASTTWPGDESPRDSGGEGEATRWVNVVGEAPLHARLSSKTRRRTDTLEHVLSTLPPSVRDVLRLFDGRRSIADVVRDCPLPRHLTLDVIGRLQLLGVLERDDKKKKRQRRRTPRVDSHEAITLPLALDGDPDDTLKSTESEAFAAEVRALRARMRREERQALDHAREHASVPWAAEPAFASSPTPAPTLAERASRLTPVPLPAVAVAEVASPFASSPTPAPTLAERPSRLTREPTPLGDAERPTDRLPVPGTTSPTVAEREALLAPYPIAGPTERTTSAVAERPPLLAPIAGPVERTTSAVEEQPDDEFTRALARQRTRRNRSLALVAGLAALFLAVVFWPEASAPPSPVALESGWLPVDVAPSSLVDAWSWTTSAVHPPRKPAEDFVVDVSPRLVRAQRLADQGRLREASELLDEAVALAPENFEAWLLRAGVRFDLGDRAHARGSAERAEELMPNDTRVQLLFATLALDQGDAEAARTALFKVLAVDPDGREGVEAKALLERLDRRGLPRVQ